MQCTASTSYSQISPQTSVAVELGPGAVTVSVRVAVAVSVSVSTIVVALVAVDTSVTVAVAVAVVLLTETEVAVLVAVVAFVTVVVFFGGLGLTGGQSGKSHQSRPSSQAMMGFSPLCADTNGEAGTGAHENLMSSRVVSPTAIEDVVTTVGDDPGQMLSWSDPVPFPETSCLRTALNSQHGFAWEAS